MILGGKRGKRVNRGRGSETREREREKKIKIVFVPSSRRQLAPSAAMAALVLVCGGPASGKTATAQAVAAALRDVGVPVVVVSEEGDPATLYAGELRVFFLIEN